MIEIVHFVAFVIFCSKVIVFSARARIRQKFNQEMGYACRYCGGLIRISTDLCGPCRSTTQPHCRAACADQLAPRRGIAGNCRSTCSQARKIEHARPSSIQVDE
jgi:hypothetical protein